MPANHPDPPIPLLTGWPDHIRSAMLHVFSLARLACGSARGWAAKQINTRLQLKAELGRCYEEIDQLREEIRIKDARMARIPARRRASCAATNPQSHVSSRHRRPS